MQQKIKILLLLAIIVFTSCGKKNKDVTDSLVGTSWKGTMVLTREDVPMLDDTCSVSMTLNFLSDNECHFSSDTINNEYLLEKMIYTYQKPVCNIYHYSEGEIIHKDAINDTIIFIDTMIGNISDSIMTIIDNKGNTIKFTKQ